MKDELGEYIEIFEVIGQQAGSHHQSVVARAANQETFIKIYKKIWRMKHQDDRAHRVLQAIENKLFEKYCQEYANCSSNEFSNRITDAFAADNDYYQGESELRQLENKIDDVVCEEKWAIMDKHEMIFRTFDWENGFDYLHYGSFFPRVSKAYVTFEQK